MGGLFPSRDHAGGKPDSIRDSARDEATTFFLTLYFHCSELGWVIWQVFACRRDVRSIPGKAGTSYALRPHEAMKEIALVQKGGYA